MQMLLHPLKLEIARPFRISRGLKTYQECLIVELRDEGLSAWGEAAAHPYFGADLSQMMALLEKQRTFIEKSPLLHPVDFWREMQPRLATQSFALAALDIAANDLWAQKQKKTLREALNIPPLNGPHSNMTLGLDTIPELLASIDRYQWPIYKVKLGGAHDLESMRAIRTHTKAVLRVDANGGWTLQQALEIAPLLQEIGVEFIEQPLPKDDWEGMKALYAQSTLPLIADESCQSEADIESCATCFHGINIKLAKCGGITPALRMIKKARALGLKVMMGCMIESRIGISAIAQLLPLLDAVDMDGAFNLKYQYADGVEINRSGLTLPAKYGIGASLNPKYRSA
ncbi:MAG: dipeptide epimerase [Bacteroidota bacterium]